MSCKNVNSIIDSKPCVYHTRKRQDSFSCSVVWRGGNELLTHTAVHFQSLWLRIIRGRFHCEHGKRLRSQGKQSVGSASEQWR